jgi:hypothetical protein
MREKNSQHTAGEYTALRNYLLAKGMQAGHVDAVLGAGPAGKTRQQIERVITAWLKGRPKG